MSNVYTMILLRPAIRFPQDDGAWRNLSKPCAKHQVMAGYLGESCNEV